jgi:hypothetical protein
LSGDNVTAFINEQKHLQRAEIRGNSYMRVMDPGRAAEVHSVNMDFYMDQDQRLQRALATSDIAARTLEGDADVQISGSNSLDVTFLAQGDSSLLKQMVAGGRPVITMSAPKSKANDPRAANKRLTANEVKLTWRTSGRDLEKAEANGDAELFVEPVVSSARAERKKLNAPQFDCDFFEAGNLARSCKATGGAKAALDPMQPVQNRGTRTLTSQNMTAVFLKDTQDMDASMGKATVSSTKTIATGLPRMFRMSLLTRRSDYEAASRLSGTHVVARRQSNSTPISPTTSHTLEARPRRLTTARNRPTALHHSRKRRARFTSRASAASFITRPVRRSTRAARARGRTTITCVATS